MIVDLASPINWHAPLNQGLVAWWIAVRGASGDDVLPEYVNNLTGTAGTGLWSSREEWGRFDAPTFDGSNDAYTIGGDTAILHLANKTVVAWVKTTSTELYAEVLSVIGGGYAGYALAFSGSGTAGRVTIYALGGGSYNEASSGSANDGAWHQIAMTHDSAGAYVLYLDGLQVGSGNAGAASYSLSSYFIGGFSGFRWSTFALGDIRVYDRLLDQGELWELYERSHPCNIRQYQCELNWLDRPFVLSTPPLTHYTLTANAGTFTLTGQDAGLYVGRAIAAESGTFAITGIDAGLTATRTIAADAGAFTLTGIDAGLSFGYVMAADAGAFALTGIDAGLTATRLITADAGAFVLTGQDATLNFGYVMTAAAGAFTLTGIDAGLTATRLLTAGTGTFTLTGIDATLTHYVPPEDNAGPGSSGIGPYGSKLRNPLTKMFKK